MEIIYRHFISLPSTNDWAKVHLSSFPQDALTVVSTDTQTAGRGRYNRSWIAPPGLNLNTTFLFFTQEPDPLNFTRILAETGSQWLQKQGIMSHIKWPNDLMVNGKKIAGILCETSPLTWQDRSTERASFPRICEKCGLIQNTAIILGIGINVNLTHEHLLLIDQPATSLLIETGKTTEISILVRDLAESFALRLLPQLTPLPAYASG